MTSADVTSADELVTDYLKRLEGELSDLPGDDLPRARRREIVEEVSAHIAEARASGGVESEAEVLTLLDRIGDPDEIVAEARAARLDLHPATPGSREVWTLVLLGAGGIFLPLVGWIVGAFLLWGSPVWSRKEKLIGTLATVGLAPGPWLYLSAGCSRSPGRHQHRGDLVPPWLDIDGLRRARRNHLLGGALEAAIEARGSPGGFPLRGRKGTDNEYACTAGTRPGGTRAAGIPAYSILVRGNDGTARSEADMKQDVTKAGNEWAPLFAKDALAACDLMYTPTGSPRDRCA